MPCKPWLPFPAPLSNPTVTAALQKVVSIRYHFHCPQQSMPHPVLIHMLCRLPGTSLYPKSGVFLSCPWMSATLPVFWLTLTSTSALISSVTYSRKLSLTFQDSQRTLTAFFMAVAPCCVIVHLLVWMLCLTRITLLRAVWVILAF